MKYYIFTGLLFLTACAGGNGIQLHHYIDRNDTKDNFIYCYGYSCSQSQRLGFNNFEWQEIIKIFKPKAITAEQERVQIGNVIAMMETYTAHLAGTQNDGPKAPIKRQSIYELDCIDETINTSQYLKFLDQEGLLHFHHLGHPAFRGGLFTGMYPHNSAVIIEIETNTPYVIDSYIYANGVEPDIRTLQSWFDTKVEDLKE